MIVTGGKPYRSVANFKNDGRFHLAPVDYAKPLQNDYLPATLTSKDYPNLIAEGETVDTIAVPAVLAAYNWAPNTERYRKLAQFVDAFFTKFPTFQNPPFHPKWKEVSLSAPLQDWQRLPYAEQWLKTHNVEAVTRTRFDEFLKQSPATAAKIQNDGDREALFKQFQAWEAERNARAQVRPAAAARSRSATKRYSPSKRIRLRVTDAQAERPSFDSSRERTAVASRAVCSTSAGSSPRFSAARAASRCSGVMLLATMRIAVASTAASSVKPSIGSMSGTKSNGRMK